MYKQSFVVLALLAAGSIVGCGKNETPATENPAPPPSAPNNIAPSAVAVEPTAAPIRRGSTLPKDIQIRLKTNAGDIIVRLYPDKAPRTVENFLDYARDGFYDGTVVHHAEPGLVILGGCDQNMELKATRFPILNEANNGLANRRGTLAMARLPESAHSATTQFFINLTDNAAFNYRNDTDEGAGYCVFGEVISGLEIAEQIGRLPTGPKGDFSNVPQQAIVIEAVEDIGSLAANQADVPRLR